MKFVFQFSLQHLPENLINPGRIQRRITKKSLFLKAPVTFPSHFNQISYLPRITLVKVPQIRSQKNPSTDSPVVPRGQTDRHDDAKSNFSQLREGA
jgi:hypothetical protein